MKGKLKEIREKAIKLALAYVTNNICDETPKGGWKESHVTSVRINEDLTVTVHFHEYGAYGAEWNEYVELVTNGNEFS